MSDTTATGSDNKYLSLASIPTSSTYVLPKAPAMRIGGDVTTADAVRVECQCTPAPCPAMPPENHGDIPVLVALVLLGSVLLWRDRGRR